MPASMRLFSLTFLFCVHACTAVSVPGEEVGEEPGTTFKYHSFQVEVRAGLTDCFYQEISHNTSFTLIWHVMSTSGQGELAVTVTLKRESDNKIFYESPYGQMGDHRESNLGQGTYEICIDNEQSYTRKKVYLWVDYNRQLSWTEAVAGDSSVRYYELKRDLVQDIMQTLEGKLHDMAYYQTFSKQQNLYDETVLQQLYDIVNYRSMLACTSILLSAIVQVIFVRKLFAPVKTVTNAGI